MKLVIVESPAKSKTISRYLGKGYTVKASVGHVRDLPKSNKKAIDVEKDFQPFYENKGDKEAVLAEITKLAAKASEVILATDPDREGEAIAWHIAQAANLKNPKRVVFNEITKEAILEAMKHPRRIDQNLRKAQEARRVLDRLVGYDLSGLIWKKVRYGLSAGRVQSPALRILMEREREIRAFVPETFWTIVAEFKNGGSIEFQMTCTKEPRDKKEVEDILKKAKSGNWKVLSIKETEVSRKPYPPFTTSTLQQAASSRLGFPPFKTMSLAQKLYEAGHITYMRTDSMSLSDKFLGKTGSFIKTNFGDDYYHPRHFKTRSKNAQEAHEAIRPTSIEKEEAGFSQDQKKLYRLIRQRTLACQMQNAKMLRTKIIANTAKKDVPDFAVNGSRVLFDGWLKADPGARKNDIEVPKLAKDDPLTLLKVNSDEKETQPPARYSEARLIKELEKRGIGRPSTYAPIIKTIKDRGYVEKVGTSLRPTDTGDVVSSFLEQHFMKYISDSFTAEMEDTLDEIAQGKKEYSNTLKKFYGPFVKDVKSKEDSKKITTLEKADAKHKCPECGGKMVVKLGKSGKFLSCAKYPKCTGSLTIDGKKIEGPKELKEKCPECGNTLVQRDGRFGKFIACSNYPKCKFIKNDPKEEKKRNTGIKCPVCGKGEMTERRGKFGTFYGCSNYPDCRNAIKAKPTGKTCTFKRKDKGGKVCGALMMEGTKTIPERCSDKTCPNHNPHKLNEK